MQQFVETEKVEEEQKKEHKEIVIRAPQSQQITKILAEHNIQLNNKNQIGGRKTEEQKTETTKKIVVRKQTQSLFLQNNCIRSVAGLRDTLNEVMWNPGNLMWLDLSYNYLEHIEDEYLNFPQLKTLYLHGNYFSNLEQVRKLNEFECLQSLTLYGNPIEQITNYRLWVLGVMYEYSEELRRLDQVLVTNREFDKVLVWRSLHLKETKKFKNANGKIQQPKKPPPLKTEDDEKKGQPNTH